MSASIGESRSVIEYRITLSLSVECSEKESIVGVRRIMGRMNCGADNERIQQAPNLDTVASRLQHGLLVAQRRPHIFTLTPTLSFSRIPLLLL